MTRRTRRKTIIDCDNFTCSFILKRKEMTRENKQRRFHRQVKRKRKSFQAKGPPFPPPLYQIS